MKCNNVNLKGRSLRVFIIREYNKGNITDRQLKQAGLSRGLITRLRNKEPNIGLMVDTFQKMYEISTGNKLQF